MPAKVARLITRRVRNCWDPVAIEDVDGLIVVTYGVGPSACEWVLPC